MAIEQSVFVAFGVESERSSSGGVKSLSVANAKPQYKCVTLSLETEEHENMQILEQASATWAKYVLCGVLGVRDAHPETFEGEEKELQILVDGDIPAGCGLSSSSALVVATALASSSALRGQEVLSRVEMAELCRRAEHRVGTMGGGMDQAVSCLARRGVALHLDFSSVPARSSPVCVPDNTVGVTFVVANSFVVAEKAVDAATRFNKRVAVITSAASLKLQQRALHVWSEAERVKTFRAICASMALDVEKQQPSSIQKQLQNLGKVMIASHFSCRILYECSCPELDALVDAAISAGALGARLTGAGWGGCIVALVNKPDVASFIKQIEVSYYRERGIASVEATNAMFESIPASGADIFVRNGAEV
ncbi:unnamed protein product [Phytophthora fragariaefolia]|uniref:Unnamed protein product n=1 Tax=Phytophthora fragariaefolia TaxID=1490495 RepID=A0A9W6YNN6_9STRA|nr:unnamed protein product [Phytophthora fragariaefolia]